MILTVNISNEVDRVDNPNDIMFYDPDKVRDLTLSELMTFDRIKGVDL